MLMVVLMIRGDKSLLLITSRVFNPYRNQERAGTEKEQAEGIDGEVIDLLKPPEEGRNAQHL